MQSYLAARQRIDTIRAQFAPRPRTYEVAEPDQSFAVALASATDRVGTGAVNGAAPIGYQGLSNGRIPDEMLVDIGEGHRLHPAAAVQFQRLRAAMAADGLEVEIASSYRTVEHQQELVDRLGLFSEGGLAAAAGHSNHGWGISVDLEDLDETTMSWLQQHAGRFGWQNDVAREPWHWTFTADPSTMEFDLR